MVTEKFDELYNKYANATYILDRAIKVKLKEIIVCQEECDPSEQVFTYQIIDKFCEVIELLEERNDEYCEALKFKCSGLEENPGTNLNQFMAFPNNQNTSREDSMHYNNPGKLLDDFYKRFVKKDPPSPDDDGKKSPSTMNDYVARIKTFASSEQYLDEMLSSGVLGIREINTDPILFTYNNIELILARFNTKDENGVAIKQRNNIRSALRLLNDFKREKTSNL